MITSLGKFLRKVRLDYGEILKNMADRLNVSSAFLSAVENGKKRMPDTWYEKLKDNYSLSEEQIEDLIQADFESRESLEISLSDVSVDKQRLAISFARQFDSLDEETSQRIINILNKNSGGK